MTTWQNNARLAVHRRADELAFLQHWLRTLEAKLQSHAVQENTSRPKEEPLVKILERERDLADELLHTRQIEPLGEALQRRIAMAEYIYQDLSGKKRVEHPPASDACRIADIEIQALKEMLAQWWAWLDKKSI